MRTACDSRIRRSPSWRAIANALLAGVVVAGAAAAAAPTPAPDGTRAVAATTGRGAPHAATQPPSTSRTLDAITIEGEIAVPQVLFITSREQPRYRDLLHRRYLRTSVDAGEQAGLPSSVVIKESRP